MTMNKIEDGEEQHLALDMGKRLSLKRPREEEPLEDGCSAT